MAAPVPEQIGELLGRIAGHGTFAARRSARTDDLHIEVKGVGVLRFPVSRAQAERLCHVARPARYGRGDQTLLDERVRNAWEVPKSRVRIDRRRWKRTLLPVLDRLRRDLGLPGGYELKAELHSMLVYAPGQFFLPHQDSEKADEMVGTLVVTLPSSFKGGAFVIEHRGEKVTYRGSKQLLSCIAFYADCHHEVRPVKQGYRIVLTYNLMCERVRGAASSTAVSSSSPDPATVDALAERLREHFETPLPSRRPWDEDAPPQDPPNRLVYLLDHQYTERGLGWNRLKGDDVACVAALRTAAEQAGCEMVLALAEIHETWSCMDDGWDERWYARSRSWRRGEDDEWYADDDPPADDPDQYMLVDLQDWGIRLDRWMDAAGKKTEPILTDVYDYEVSSTTPTSALDPYASEYEGYMGNYGNTMDRWYRRAAAVLWPRERAFAVRAEASPTWALTTLKKRIRAGSVPEAQELAESLLPFWGRAAMREKRRGFFDKALSVAEGLTAPELAETLLQPFRVEALTPRRAPAFVALVRRYGERWARTLLSQWSTPHDSWMRLPDGDRLAWLASLPRLCEALSAGDDREGTAAARLLVHDQWGWLSDAIEAARRSGPPSVRDEALSRLATPILAFLEAAVIGNAGDLHQEAVTLLCADENGVLLPCLTSVLSTASESLAPEVQAALGLPTVQRRCVELLEMRLSVPARDENDWSIALPDDCCCELCRTLAGFLAARDEKRLDWPLAKERRRHVHGILDTHELPVRHETRRSGRPYTLVLTKTDALFDREEAERRSWQTDLDWLARDLP